MNTPEWDKGKIGDFFDYCGEPYRFEDDDATIYRTRDQCLQAEIVFLPVRGVVCFTLRDPDASIIMDLSVAAYVPFDRRTFEGADNPYCHECSVLPGLHAYSPPAWYQFFDYATSKNKAISAAFTHWPRISLRFFDPSPETGASNK